MWYSIRKVLSCISTILFLVYTRIFACQMKTHAMSNFRKTAKPKTWARHLCYWCTIVPAFCTCIVLLFLSYPSQNMISSIMIAYILVPSCSRLSTTDQSIPSACLHNARRRRGLKPSFSPQQILICIQSRHTYYTVIKEVEELMNMLLNA